MQLSSLKTKMISIFAILGIGSIVTMGLISYLMSSKALHEERINKLIAIRDIKKTEIENYFKKRIRKKRFRLRFTI